MKVAVCLSGYVRTYKKTFPTLLEHVIKPFAAKVFFHTWETTNNDGVHPISEHVAELHKMYDAVGTEFEVQDIVNGTSFAPPQEFADWGRHSVRAKPMFYGIRQAVSMATFSKDSPFDVIIRARFDSYFMAQPDLNVDMSKVYVLEFCDDTVNDQFAYGGQKVMKAYASCFDCLDRHLASGCGIANEQLLRWHLKWKNIPVECSNLRVSDVRLER